MKLTAGSPAYCSSCFQAKPGMRHVDFEAYYDGPIIESKNFKQPIDDLIICEDCLKVAGELVDLSEHAKLLRERNELKQEVQALRKYRIDAEEKFATLATLTA